MYAGCCFLAWFRSTFISKLISIVSTMDSVIGGNGGFGRHRRTGFRPVARCLLQKAGDVAKPGVHLHKIEDTVFLAIQEKAKAGRAEL